MMLMRRLVVRAVRAYSRAPMLALLCTLGLGVAPAAAQRGTTAVASTQTPAAPREATTVLPLAYPRAATFTTDEGTWLSLDVSPDGRTVVFDLAGDLYTLPIGGGRATRITDGPGFDGQPRFSPDGAWIVFHSDRSGTQNLYLVRPDGRDVRALTTGTGRKYLSPEWTPDGRHIVVSGGGGAHHLYLYPKEGGPGTDLTARSAAGPDGGSRRGGFPHGGAQRGAAFGPAARYVYFSASPRAPAGNVAEFRWSVQRYDFVTGDVEDVAAAPGSAMRPVLSPDGRWLVYATRYDTVTSLRLLDLTTGEDRWLTHDVQRDDQASAGTRDLLPGSAFTPDSKALITAHHGKLWRVAVPSGQATPIPFTADIDVPLGELVHFEYPLNDSTLTVTQIRDPRLSPDNQRVVFTALDRLYVMDLPHGTPRRLTKTEDLGEFHPVWSPDGKWIAYVTWNDTTGAVYRVRADGRGRPERLTRQGGYYRRVNYTPSGSRLLVWRAVNPLWRAHTSRGLETRAALGWIPATGGAFTVIPSAGDEVLFPSFINGDSTRIYLGTESIRWDGTDRQRYLREPASTARESLSPTGDRIFSHLNGFGFITLTVGTVPLARDVTMRFTPPDARTVGGVSGVEFPAWSPDGTKLTWAVGRFFFIYDLARGDSAAQEDPATPGAAGYAPERIEIAITLPKDRPRGVVALRNARLITMRGDAVLERGDLVITNNRITAIGPAGTVPIPAGATTLNLTGTTIMPGLVDIHAHPSAPSDIHPRQWWTYAAALAYGVTTTRDPQAGLDVLTYQDRVETGDLLGPRVFSTGPGIDGDFATYDEAHALLRRYAESWHTNTVKAYGVGTRKARQYFLMAAQALRLTPTLEGARDFRKNLTEVIDGFAGSEHSYPITPLYRDMVELIARSGITYTPTLLVDQAGPVAREYMYQKYQHMHADPKLRRFVPHVALDWRFLRRDSWFADDQYAYRHTAAQAAKIVRAGGRVGLGGHGELPGLGEHWELWLLQSGGMTPLEALRCATLFGAEAIGLGNDLGSLEVGKLADLIVLEKNPLEDIHHTAAIRYVMKNGRLYEGDTLDEIWPRKQAMARTWWMESATEPSVHAEAR